MIMFQFLMIILMDFNLAINENKEFYNQKIFKDIEEDFFEVYSKKETRKKEERKEFQISNY